MSCQVLNNGFTVSKRRPSSNLTKILNMSSDHERKLMIDSLQTIEFTYQQGDEKYFVIDNYYDLRFEKRDKSKQWPGKLSKKEIVLCKIEMIKTMLNLAYIELARDPTEFLRFTNEKMAIQIVNNEIKRIEKETYTKATPENIDSKGFYKYPGIQKRDADFLNEIYKVLIKRLQKKS